MTSISINRGLSALACMLFTLPTQAEPAERQVEVGARFDCTHNFSVNKGTSQACLTLSGLRLALTEPISPKLTASVTLDPFATTKASYANRPRLNNDSLPLVRDTPLIMVEHYAFRWQFRPRLSLSIEEFSGTTALESVSGLPFGGMLQETGWDQTALTATYLLPPLDGIQVTIAIGNGEGENGVNLDTQQYGGLGVVAGIIPGVKVKAGISFDGNTTGSQAYQWVYGGTPEELDTASTGFSTERLAVAVMLDGQLPQARGLKASIGYQHNRQSDLDKNANSVPQNYFAATERHFDISEFLVEDPTGTTTTSIERKIASFSASYQILAEYFVGLDYEARTVQVSGVKPFQPCTSLDGQNCAAEGGPTDKVGQTSYAIGGGATLDDGLVLTLAYGSSSFNKLYQSFNFRGREDQRGKTRDLFNARLSYNW